ncbi:MAG: VOC family protein, partial [Candidatus Cybelea sp.]
MSQRSHYPPGTPCWVDVLAADPESELVFYANLFGWSFIGPGPMASTGGKYFVAQMRGRDVAGVSSLPPGQPDSPGFWNTYFSVASADESCALAQRAGGMILLAPFDALPAGRMAVVRDPFGAAFSLWEPKERAGAQLLNEPSAWAMSALIAPDIEKTKSFYRTLFGWEWETFGAGTVNATLCRLP